MILESPKRPAGKHPKPRFPEPKSQNPEKKRQSERTGVQKPKSEFFGTERASLDYFPGGPKRKILFEALSQKL